jgi:hypothetical protein
LEQVPAAENEENPMSGLAMNPASFPAVPLPRTGARWWTAIASHFTASATAAPAEDAKPRRQVTPPRRGAYLEDAAMRRAMHRL